MTPDQADYFRVPLLDGRFGLGQVFELPELVGETGLFCGLTSRIAAQDTQPAPFALSDVIAFCRIAPDHITSGTWPLAGFDQIPVFRGVFDYEGHRALGFPDHPVQDPAVIEAFLNAWHGLYPWDSFGPLFDRMLRDGVSRPAAG